MFLQALSEKGEASENGAQATNVIFAAFRFAVRSHQRVCMLPTPAIASTLSCHVLCMRNVACAMIWLVRLCMLPTLTPENAGDAGFLGPIRAPTQKADMGSRARAPEDQKNAAQKEQPASQPGNAKATKHRK